MTYIPILEQQIEEIQRLFAELDRKQQEQVDPPIMFVQINIQVRTSVQFITVECTL